MAKATKNVVKGTLGGVSIVLDHAAARELYKTLGFSSGSSTVYEGLGQILNERKPVFKSTFGNSVVMEPIIAPDIVTITLDLTKEEAEMLNAVTFKTSGDGRTSRRGLMDEIGKALRPLTNFSPDTKDIATGLGFSDSK